MSSESIVIWGGNSRSESDPFHGLRLWKNGTLKAELHELGIFVWAWSEQPVELAVFFLNREVVDAGVAYVHQSQLVKLPVLVSVGAKPVAGVIVIFIGESDGNAMAVEGP